MKSAKDAQKAIALAVKAVEDQKSFFDGLLAETLEWPTGDAERIGDIAYNWSEEDLRARDLNKHLIDGSIWQVQPAASNQPWGIFVLEFRHADALSPRRGMAGVLRQVLRGLVASRRRDPNLSSWKREHLLFVCTHQYKTFRFAYFRSKAENPSAARLATFGWRPDSDNRTLVEFNLPALVWPDDPDDAERWISSWAKAFDKEPLTRDFFKRFDKALEAIKSDLESHQKMSSADAYTASQLLLERLIFLYFLQNRGWLNRNVSYLKGELAKHTNSEEFTYYKEFLDKLFWTLSTAPLGAGRLLGIPFLNGGLFDDDEFRQPADTRKVSPPLKVRNGTMRYVFDELLEAFNFTVTEDTPLNQEVAVDPEMLGKVFESIVLHAEAADEDANAPDKRKGTGSYYTPRIVVHFICRETLYQYLRNHLAGDGWEPQLKAVLATDAVDGIDEEELKQLRAAITPEQARQVLEVVMPLKCCDPAVGSGAFPVGLMQELVNLRRVLETVANGKDPVLTEGQKWLHRAKAHVVENCLFGVDIQQQAIEICRLRLWLSLVVDYDLGVDPFDCDPKQFAKAIDGISQLPNLEMNFRRGDSLHDHICGVPVVILPDRSMKYFDDFKAIGKLGTELHKAKKSEKKRRLRVEILKRRLELSRKMVDEERTRLLRDDSALDGLFGMEESKGKKRERNLREIKNLDEALTKIQKDVRELEKLEQRHFDNDFYSKLRKLEGADFDSPFNFAWHIDFPSVFAVEDGGFDVVVGNPPFVTARNPEKRDLWRKRWPRICYMKYQLVSPFFELSSGLLKTKGELAFIVSNAFMKREFGIPLVTGFFNELNSQKVVDCSGLMFPGHGTPTCIVFLSNESPVGAVRVTATLSGGGDLRTPPEESELWHQIASFQDEAGFESTRIRVSDLKRSQFFTWPVNFDVAAAETKKLIESRCKDVLRARLAAEVGFMFIVGRNDIFMMRDDLARRIGAPSEFFRALHVGDEIRDYALRGRSKIIFPYDKATLKLLDVNAESALGQYFAHFEKELLNRPTFGGTFKSEGRKPYEFHQIPIERAKNPKSIALAQIATHAHFVFDDSGAAFNEKAPVLKLDASSTDEAHLRLAGVLNSSTALFWLKQVCFCKRESDEAENDTYFEFAGGKVEQLPIPENLLTGDLSEAVMRFATVISKTAAKIQSQRMFSIFQAQNPHRNGNSENPFSSGECAQKVHDIIAASEKALRRLTALQEELDWLVYFGYGLLSDSLACSTDDDPGELQRNDRPFVLWARANGDYNRAITLIPDQFSSKRRELWKARLAAIRDNEHIRRIEQPVYKRRWDEQWKVGNQWRSGEIAYAAEFIDAFEWWLSEKAEWWLEYKKEGGPVGRGEWTLAMWQDERVQAAWTVAAEKYAYLANEKAKEKAEADGDPAPAPKRPDSSPRAFERLFKQLIEEESVPAGYEFGTPYEELEKKLQKKLPPKLIKVRGKLNVPRERFHESEKDVYTWAGLQFQEKPQKSARSGR